MQDSNDKKLDVVVGSPRVLNIAIITIFVSFIFLY